MPGDFNNPLSPGPVAPAIGKPKDTEDTIAAISTAPGQAGIAIVRISGPDSVTIADKMFACAPPCPSQRPAPAVIHGFVRVGGKIIDEALLVIMRAPHSYTREDVVEFQCHGSVIAARRILNLVLARGARLAEPGEFTKRAFLNGRIDLLQAEAVLDIIRAHSDRAAAAAMDQLEGELSRSINAIYDSLIAIAADLEAVLDFSEDDVVPPVIPGATTRLNTAKARIGAILNSWDEGHVLREGALVVISGKPNVGKSTLMNCLLEKERAIVSHIPGTTRDTIEEELIIDGYPIRIVDTAGLRSSTCEIEQEGVKRAHSIMQKADIHIHIVDASQSIDAADGHHLRDLPVETSIIVLNKEDLGLTTRPADVKPFSAIVTSLIDKKGVREIKKMIIARLGLTPSRPAHAVISERHRQILLLASSSLEDTVSMLGLKQEDLLVPVISNIKSAVQLLGQITGKNYYDELLDSIFSRFCIGK